MVLPPDKLTHEVAMETALTPTRLRTPLLQVITTLLLFPVLMVCSLAQTGMAGLKKTVAFVYGQAHVKDPQGNMRLLNGPLGTAFFVAYPDSRGGPDYGFIYIVTAKHVLKDELVDKYLKSVRIRMNKRDGAGIALTDIDVSDADGKLRWFDDKDDPNADIAVALAFPDPAAVDYLTVPLSLFADSAFLKKQNVIEGDQVYLVGLMPQFTGENHNFPVVRHGYIALLSDELIPMAPNVKEHVYALELGSWPGQSGSPVFLSLGGVRGASIMAGESYSLLGVMLGYVQNERPFDIAPTDSGFIGDSSNVGISYVLPASEILKVLNSKDAQAQRDADIQKRIAAMKTSVR
jgi:hypothetical protein